MWVFTLFIDLVTGNQPKNVILPHFQQEFCTKGRIKNNTWPIIYSKISVLFSHKHNLSSTVFVLLLQHCIVAFCIYFICPSRKTRIRRRAKMRSTALSWRLQRTAPLQGWWTCMVGSESLKGPTWWCFILYFSFCQLNYLKIQSQRWVSPSVFFTFCL